MAGIIPVHEEEEEEEEGSGRALGETRPPRDTAEGGSSAPAGSSPEAPRRHTLPSRPKPSDAAGGGVEGDCGSDDDTSDSSNSDTSPRAKDGPLRHWPVFDSVAELLQEAAEVAAMGQDTLRCGARLLEDQDAEAAAAEKEYLLWAAVAAEGGDAAGHAHFWLGMLVASRQGRALQGVPLSLLQQTVVMSGLPATSTPAADVEAALACGGPVTKDTSLAAEQVLGAMGPRRAIALQHFLHALGLTSLTECKEGIAQLLDDVGSEEGRLSDAAGSLVLQAALWWYLHAAAADAHSAYPGAGVASMKAAAMLLLTGVTVPEGSARAPSSVLSLLTGAVEGGGGAAREPEAATLLAGVLQRCVLCEVWGAEQDESEDTSPPSWPLPSLVPLPEQADALLLPTALQSVGPGGATPEPGAFLEKCSEAQAEAMSKVHALLQEAAATGSCPAAASALVKLCREQQTPEASQLGDGPEMEEMLSHLTSLSR